MQLSLLQSGKYTANCANYNSLKRKNIQSKGFQVKLASQNKDSNNQEQPEANKASKRTFVQLIQSAAAASLVAPLQWNDVNLPNALVQNAQAALPQSEPITNAKQLLRNALPINNQAIRKVQNQLEVITEQLRVPGKKPTGPISNSVNAASRTLKTNKDNIIKSLAPSKKQDGLNNIKKLEDGLIFFQKEVLDKEDKQSVPIVQQELLDYVGSIEEDMVDKFPFEIPNDLKNLPQLKGRAIIAIDLELRSVPQGPKDAQLILAVDGYNAPITAGNFVDLINKKFYDGMPIQRADGFVVQTGKPEGKEDGYVDPNTGEIRRIPLEVKVVGDKQPVYGETLEELGRFNEQPILPFNAFGTLAQARQEFDPLSASSQVFWLLKDIEITPAGANLLDGNFAVFGYIIQGQDILKDCKVGDIIKQASIVSGGENLVVA